MSSPIGRWIQEVRDDMAVKSARKALIASDTVLEAAQDSMLNLRIGRGGSQQVRDAWQQFQSAGYGFMYSHQPAVRKVVDYIAANVAQLRPKLYERVSDTERVEREDSEAAQVLRQPNPWTPGKQFIFDTFADFLVYNNAYALKIQPSVGARRYLLSIPTSSIAVLGKGVSQLAGYQIFRTDGSWFVVEPEEIIHWRGYDASDRRMGVSKLETLRSELAEQAASQRANVDLMESGLQQRGYIKRPLEAPDWNEQGGKERFIEQFRAAMKKADRGYPILEEGMEIAPLGVSPKDAEMLESRKLFSDEVAQQFGMVHCPPQSEEERRQFYADVLPPLCALFCDFLCTQFLSVEYAQDNYYFEFDLKQKQMSDDRLKALVSAAGAPIMTRNEARSDLNLPALDGADDLMAPEDQLVVPLNVLTGGKPSPAVMPIQDPNKPDQGGGYRDGQEQPKSLLDGRHEEEVAERLVNLYKRQERALASGRPFEIKRWNRELTQDLAEVFDSADPVALESIANQINSKTMAAVAGPEPDAAFAKLKTEVVRWSQDIDRARVMLVAASLLDAGESGEPAGN
jgi:HK97 family phage portal protein